MKANFAYSGGNAAMVLCCRRLLARSSLKIDRSFVAEVNDDPSDATIVRTSVEMAHSGFTVIAEGVETDDQRAFLLARPMQPAEFAAPLSARRVRV